MFSSVATRSCFAWVGIGWPSHPGYLWRTGWMEQRLAAIHRRPFGWAETAFYEFVGAPAARQIVSPVLLDELGASGARRILDVGCGSGELTGDLTGPGRFVVGVEPSSAQLRRCARHHDDRCTIAGAASEALPFASHSFDAVVSSCTIKHWRDMAQGLNECARLVRPGGLLVIVEIDGGESPDDLRRFAARTRLPPGLRRLYPALAHRTFVPHSPGSAVLTRAIAAAGFDHVRVRRIPDLPFVVATGIRPPTSHV